MPTQNAPHENLRDKHVVHDEKEPTNVTNLKLLVQRAALWAEKEFDGLCERLGAGL